MEWSTVSRSRSRSRLMFGGALVFAALTSCAGPNNGWEQPVEAGHADDPNVAVTSQPITTPVQGVYVVTAEVADAYCDNVLFAGNHGAAIQSCIDRANADGGGIVLLRGSFYNGTWPLTLKANVTLKGDGYGRAYLTPPSGANVIGSVADQTAIEDLVFSTANLTSGAILLGASGTSHSRIRIENNFFSSFSPTTAARYGIQLRGGGSSFRDILIRANTFDSLTSSGPFHPVYFEDTTGTGSLSYVRVEDNVLEANNGGMINLSSIGTNGRGIVVSGNVMRTVQSSQNAIFVAGTSNGLIKNNVLVGYTMSIGVTGPSPGCSAAVMGNVTSDSPVINSGCAQNTVVTGNSDNRPGVLGSSSLIGKAGVLVRAHRTGTQSFTAGTGSGSGAYVVFNTEDVDNGRNYSEGIGVFTAPVAGYYHAHACVRFNAAGFGATESANLSFEIPGASITPSLNRTTSGGSADTFTSCVDDVIQLASGAGLQVFVSSNGSGTRSLSGTGVYSTYLYVTQVSD